MEVAGIGLVGMILIVCGGGLMVAIAVAAVYLWLRDRE